jgi:glycopeptide antibiotics resistance protein
MENKSQQEKKLILKKEVITYVIILYSMMILSLILFNLNQNKIKREKFQLNKIVYFTDTTGIWTDNFDSSYVFNGCIHYTHKQI